MEESSSNPPKKQSGEQLSGQVSTDDTNTKLLKQMEGLKGRMKHMEDRLEQQSKAIFDSKKVSFNQESFTYNNSYNNRGRGYGKGYYKGSYNRGYQTGYLQDSFSNFNSQRGNRGSGSKGGNRSGTNGRGAHRGNSSQQSFKRVTSPVVGQTGKVSANSVNGPSKSTDTKSILVDRLVGSANESEIVICGAKTSASIDTGSMITSISESFYDCMEHKPELHDISELG